MRKVIPIICFLTFLSTICVIGQIKVIKETKEENKVCNLILMLPEVKNADRYVRSVTKGKRHLVTMILSDPTEQDNYYYVKVAEDNGVAYHTHFIFLVDPDNYSIKYLDVITNKRVPLKLCSKRLLDEYRISK